jgi:hypothetical protein
LLIYSKHLKNKNNIKGIAIKMIITLLDLPDEILINLIKKYIDLDSLKRLYVTCKRFHILIDSYNIWNKHLKFYPIVDFNYPNGHNKYFIRSSLSNRLRNARQKLNLVENWMKKRCLINNIYQYKTK